MCIRDKDTYQIENEIKKVSKTIKGASDKVVVICAAEIDNVKEKTRRIKLSIIPEISKAEIMNFIANNISPGSRLRYSKGFTCLDNVLCSYSKIQRLQIKRRKHSQSAHVGLVFTNLKKWLTRVYAGISSGNLQEYLDEYSFRFNSRRKLSKNDRKKVVSKLLGLS